MAATASQLIGQLIDTWCKWDENEELYLNELIPNILCGKIKLEITEEKTIFQKLEKLLYPEEWKNLPTLVKQRRANIPLNLLSDKEREDLVRQAGFEAAKEITAKREAEKRRRQEIEQERIRRKEAEIHRQKEIEQERIRLMQEEERKQRELMLRLQKEKESRDQFIKQIEEILAIDFLSVDNFYLTHPDSKVINKESFIEIKAKFVQNWVQKTLNLPVDLEQAAAIAALDGDIQVVARAGSGKTRTLVTRAIFLQEHCHVHPNEMLLLAFNTNAVKEIKERIESTTGQLPHVMTFHALAHAIVHPEEEIIYDDTSASQLKLSKEIQDVIDEHIRSPQHHNLIRDIMLMHFRENWEKIIQGKYHLNLDDRRKLSHESLKGDFVKSFGEKVITNILFENSIEYKYERNFRWSGINYRPDFTILLGKDEGVVIEYFGMQGDCDYDEMSERKREFWESKKGWHLLEYSPSDITSQGLVGFERRLLHDFNQLNVRTRKRTDEDIWNQIKDRAIDRFTQTIQSFVGRCRKLNLSPSALRERVTKHAVASTAEGAFLNAAVSVYEGYIERLKSNNQDDFDGLMWRAIEIVKHGQTRFARNKGREQGDLTKLKFILIDEFQDFSQMFYQLSMAIRKVNKQAQFFCVGDDWQAINEFAGSELRFFREFSKYFSNTSRYDISSNYRSPYSIVQVGNALMHGLGKPAFAFKQSHGDALLCSLDELNLSSIEQSIHNGDEITPAILRLIRFHLDRGEKIVMLSRRNGIPWFVNYSDTIDIIGNSKIAA